MNFPVHVVNKALRAIPNWTPGKTRLARAICDKWNCDEPIEIADRFGNRLVVPSLREPVATAVFSSGVYEPETIGMIARYLPDDGVFMDVGANVGAISLPIAALRPQGHIIAVEADPRIASVLRNNAAANKRNNVTVIECIAGPNESRVCFYRAPADHFGMGSIGPQFADSNELLPQKPLDDVLDKLGVERLDVTKLDIEGAEFGALRGLSRRLTSANPPVVIFEFAGWAESRIGGQRPGDAQRYLQSLGYSLLEICRRNTLKPLMRPATTGSMMLLAIRK